MAVYAPNNGGTPVTVQNPPLPDLSPYLACLYAEFYKRNVWLEYFAFSAVWNPLAASATGQQANMTIDPSIDFIALEMNLTARDPTTFSTGPVEGPAFLLEVMEKSGNTNWQDAPIDVSNWTGQPGGQVGNIGYRLPFARYIRGNNTVTFKMTNLVATAFRVDLALLGIRATYLRVSREALFGVPF